jgi:SMODS and SLOG-associating 2TM effector domain family 4
MQQSPRGADMFQLSLIDHIRLSFGSVTASYRAHARAAERLAARAWQSKVVVMLLFCLATAATLVALTGLRQAQIAAAVLTGLAVLAFAIYVSLGFEARAYAHRACAAQLWLLCEKYRALLAEVHDGLIDLADVTRRRDDLMREVQIIYEHALPADRDAYQIAREALGAGESAPSDQEIDRLLPASLRHAARAPSAS